MQLQPTLLKMPNKLKLQLMRHKVLLLAILCSILLHMLFLGGFSINLPQLAGNEQILEMRLVKLQSKPIPKPAPVIKKNSIPRQKLLKRDSTTIPAPSNEIVPSSAPVNLTENARSATHTDTMQAVPEETPATEMESLDETPEYIFPEEAPKAAAYTHVETEFEVMRGINTPAAGITKIVFNIDANGRYSITSSTQAKGLASLFFGDLVQKSEGTVTENGLKPDFYSYQYGNDAKKSQTASFDWTTNVLHMHTVKGDSTANLVAGTQDYLSFMYQFMFTPPLSGMQFTMTNGKRLRTYTFSFEGEEVIVTKLGDIKTLHLLKSGNDEEKTEIWLASDYQHLPVKIRKTEKDGTVIEQVTANIHTKTPN